MALFDLPAMIDYVLNTTKMSSLGYIGHSQGTMMAFSGTSVNSDLASKLNVLIALGPVSTVKYITSPIRYLAPISRDTEVRKNSNETDNKSIDRIIHLVSCLNPAFSYLIQIFSLDIRCYISPYFAWCNISLAKL